MTNTTDPPDTERPGISAVKLCEEAGISYRQADYWTRTGLLTPTGPAFAQGSGHHRSYDRDQQARAKAIGDLLRAGMSLARVRKQIDEILRVGALTYGPVTITYNPKD